MISHKDRSLKALLSSSDGLHLSAYLPATSHQGELRNQLMRVIGIADGYLKPVLTEKQRAEFLEPIKKLVTETELLSQLKKNIGLFRTPDAFRILTIPVEVEPTCVVADSFHVKPLLRWLQNDRDFLLIGLNEKSASIFFGSQVSFKHLDEVLFPEPLTLAHRAGNSRSRRDGQMRWLSQWIHDVTENVKPAIFLAGPEDQTRSLIRHLKYENLYPQPIQKYFVESQAKALCESIRLILRRDAIKRLENALVEFAQAEGDQLAKTNLFQIAKAAVSGRVRKLIIADGVSVFGRLNKNTGSIVIHPEDLDHQDDDLLDDLAQAVLKNGGEVVVAKRDEIPNGRPILAIFDPAPEEPLLSWGAV